MAIQMVELVESRRVVTGGSPSAEFTYSLSGTASESAAKSAALAGTAGTYDGLTRQTIDLEPVWVDTVAGDGRWTATVRYGLQEPVQTDQSTYQFDTGGGSRHITNSLETVHRYAASGTAPDYRGAVGVTADGVEGVDITVPVYNFSETHYKADSFVTPAYKAKLFALTGKVNGGPFKGFAAGEVLFLGASGSKRGADQWEIAFRFAASPNRTGLAVGDITGIAKNGWEYLWVRYEDQEDAAAKALVKRPVAAYVERVYEGGDFSDLGIGTE